MLCQNPIQFYNGLYSSIYLCGSLESYFEHLAQLAVGLFIDRYVVFIQIIFNSQNSPQENFIIRLLKHLKDLNFKCHSKGSELSGKFDIVVNLIYIYFFFISKYHFLQSVLYLNQTLHQKMLKGETVLGKAKQNFFETL